MAAGPAGEGLSLKVGRSCEIPNRIAHLHRLCRDVSKNNDASRFSNRPDCRAKEAALSAIDSDRRGWSSPRQKTALECYRYDTRLHCKREFSK